jgi:hypothetical protein
MLGVGDEATNVATGWPEGKHAVISPAMTAAISCRIQPA